MEIKKLILEWKWTILFGLGVVILFFFLRLINLTILPIFADEAIYIRWSQVMRAESTLRFLPLTDGKQPLFMWILMPILGFFQDPLVAGRMLSVFSGLATMVGVFLLSFSLFRSKSVALASSFLYAVVPFAVFFDRLALVDSLLATFGVWILFFSVLLVENPRLDLAMITGLILGGGLLTKSPALFFVLLLPAAVIMLSFTSRKELAQKLVILAGLWIVVYGLAFMVYSILRLGPSFHMIALRNKDYVFSFREVLSHPLDPFKPHIGQVWEWFMAFLGLPLILTYAGGLAGGVIRFRKQILLLVVWFLLPLFAQMAFAKVFTARYIFFTIPAFLLVCGFFLGWLFEKTKTFILSGLVLIVILVPIVFFNFYLLTNPRKVSLPAGERSGYFEEWTSGYGISQVRDYLLSLPKDKQVVVGTEGAFGTLPDGLQIYFDKNPNITIVGIGLGLEKIPEPLQESASKGTPTYLVVNKSRMGAQSDPGLKLIFEVPKAKGKKGQDFLLLYQVK